MNYSDQNSRPCPSDIPSEAALLAAMMMDSECLSQVLRMLEAHHFLRPAHAILFGVIRDLHRQGQPTEPGAVFVELTSRNLLDQVGRDYFSEILECPGTSGGYYAT